MHLDADACSSVEHVSCDEGVDWASISVSVGGISSQRTVDTGSAAIEPEVVAADQDVFCFVFQVEQVFAAWSLEYVVRDSDVYTACQSYCSLAVSSHRESVVADDDACVERRVGGLVDQESFSWNLQDMIVAEDDISPHPEIVRIECLGADEETVVDIDG